jgi:hypothetical protein
LVLAAFVVAADAVLFAVLAKRATSTDASCHDLQIEDHESKQGDLNKSGDAVVLLGSSDHEITNAIPRDKASHAEELVAVWLSGDLRRLRSLPTQQQRLLLAHRASRRAWTPQSLRHETLRSLRQEILRALPNKQEPTERDRAVSPELEKWKIIPVSKDAFNVVAGAFEIEYFHGRTNIRVLDPTSVTVEGPNRGEKSEVAPPEVRPAVWH